MPRDRRVNITLAVQTISDLQQWADQTGHTVTSLCTWLVKRSLTQAIQSGEFKPETVSDKDSLAIAYIKALDGGTIDILDLQRLADEIQTESEVLAKILKQVQEKRNGKPA